MASEGAEGTDITDVRVKRVEPAVVRLLVLYSITIHHAFVFRDLKIIGGSSGEQPWRGGD